MTAGVTYLRDVARVELGAKSQDQTCTLDGKSSAALAIFQLPGSNALATADRVRAKMEELKDSVSRPGSITRIVYDTTPFTRESIKTVIHTLFEAFILVAIVVLVFLQNWRATLIPLIAVPVSLDRHIRGHGAARLLAQQSLAFWLGAGHRHCRR